jgi:hypothetical protein
MKKNNNGLFILAITALAITGILFATGNTGLAVANGEKLIIAINDNADEKTLITATQLINELSAVKATPEQIKFYSEIYPGEVTKHEMTIILGKKALIILNKKASGDYETAAETTAQILQQKGYQTMMRYHTDITLKDIAETN